MTNSDTKHRRTLAPRLSEIDEGPIKRYPLSLRMAAQAVWGIDPMHVVPERRNDDR